MSYKEQVDESVGSLIVDKRVQLGVEGTGAFLSFFNGSGSASKLTQGTIAASVTSTATIITNLNNLITSLKTYGLIA